MKPVFKDSTIQQHFDTFGFVVVDLLNLDDLQLIAEEYNKYIGDTKFDNFVTTYTSFSSDVKSKVADYIDKIVTPKILRFMCDVEFWPGAFLIKPSTENSEFQVHQDWTFVDEEKFVSGNIWIPLNDVDVNNGCLSIIESSQYPNIKSIRSQTIPDFFHTNRALLKPLLKPLKLKAGQGLIFNHSLIHYSSPNKSGFNRVAISKGFHSNGATLLHYLRTSVQEVELYEMPDNFVYNTNNLEDLKYKSINGKMINKFVCPDKSYNDSEIIEIITNKNRNLIQLHQI